MRTEDIIPETGEWTASLKPNDFIVVLNNTGDTLKGIDRVAIVFSLGHQEPQDGDGQFETEMKVTGLFQVDGRYPGAEIPKTPESEDFLHSNLGRVEVALNAWNDQPQEIREFFWKVPTLEDLARAYLGK